MRVDYGSVSPDIGRVCRAEALVVLSDLPDWRIPSAAWDEIGALVERLAEALVSGDTDAAQTAVNELEAESGPRAGGIGAKGDEPPPPMVRDLAVHLVHSLGGTSKDEAPGTAEGDGPAPKDAH